MPDVAAILRLIPQHRLTIVGGQAIRGWANVFSQDARFAALGELSTEDLDVLRDDGAAEALLAALDDSVIHRPAADDHTPEAAIVIGNLGTERIQVDFMDSLAGVDSRYARVRALPIAIDGVVADCMHPLDCLHSRLANVNLLHRMDALSIRQLAAAFLICENHIDSLLATGEIRPAIDLIMSVDLVLQRNHRGRLSDGSLDLTTFYQRFINDDRLDERWRTLTLTKAFHRIHPAAALPTPR